MSQNDQNFDQRVAEAVDDSLTVSEVDLLNRVDYNLKYISYVPKHPPVNRSRKRTPWPIDWLRYEKCGEMIEFDNLAILPIKSPVENDETNQWLKNEGLSAEVFTWENVVASIQNTDLKIDTVIDLTAVRQDHEKYYQGSSLLSRYSINYYKVKSQGGGRLPTEESVDEFCAIISKIKQNDIQKPIVVVHCTHGLNRTGYFIIQYLIKHEGYDAVSALSLFEKKRGHVMKHKHIRRYLLGLDPGRDLVTSKSYKK